MLKFVFKSFFVQCMKCGSCPCIVTQPIVYVDVNKC